MDADGCGEHQGVQVSLAPPRWPTRGQISSLCTPGVKDLDEKRKKVKIFRFCQFNYLSLLPMYIMYIHRQEPTAGSTHVALSLSTCCGPSVGNSVTMADRMQYSVTCVSYKTSTAVSFQMMWCYVDWESANRTSSQGKPVNIKWMIKRLGYVRISCSHSSSRLVSLMWIKALTGDVRRLNPSCWKPDLLCENCAHQLLGQGPCHYMFWHITFLVKILCTQFPPHKV